jgi:Mrp family chromosome partitioning ATPase/DUF971 family protein
MSLEEKQREVLASLSHIIDPDLGRDIVSLGFVKELNIEEDVGKVSFEVELTTPACPLKASFKEQCEAAVNKLSWVKETEVTMSSRKPPKPSKRARPETPAGVSQVAHIVAVSSAKGGVGKSTVAVNLAYALADTGAKVGLLDADIFGPSLPTLVRPADTQLVGDEDNMLRPLEYRGIKLMSFGWATSSGQAAIMRGPMVSNLTTQLALGTNWGPLDYLIVDMPPGTGDIQLTLTQQLDFSGALIVTTPQQLSFADVIRGIEMFSTVKVPTLGLVENMSYFVCPSCSEKHHPFGEGARARITDLYGIRATFEIPMHEALSRQSDAGEPIVLAEPGSDLSKIYVEIAGGVAQEVSKAESGLATPTVTHDAQKGIVMAWPDGRELTVDPAALRRACKCADCVSEHTGEPLLKPEEVPDDVIPTMIEKRGNYAVAVNWSDGHTTSIYPFEAIERVAKG